MLMRLLHANAGQSFQEVTAGKDAHLQRPESVEMTEVTEQPQGMWAANSGHKKQQKP